MINSLFKDVTRKTSLTHDEKLAILGIIVGSIGSFIAGCFVQMIWGHNKEPGA